MQPTLLTLLAASSVCASPVWKRQSISSAASSVIASISEAASSAAAPTLTSASVASSAITSLASSASSAAAPSASASAAETYPGYPCPAGTDLSYVEVQQNYNEALADITAIVGNFTTATWLNVINPSGEDTVGVTRTLQFNNATTVTEVLVNKTTNAETGATFINWNNTAPLTLDGLTVYNYSTVLQSYINDTETTDAAPVSTVKIFSNFCTDQQALGIQGLTEYFQAALGNVETSTPVAPTSSGAVSSLASASSIASSAASSVSSAASSAVSSVSSAVASVTSAASSIASSASSVAAPSATGPPGSLLINTPPSIVQCQPALISFSGGAAPYFLSVLPGGQAGAAPLVEFPSQPAAGGYTWVVNLPAGTSITLSIRDSTGLVNFSSPLSILASADSSCIGVAPSARA